ncbi:MAG: protein translocase subunit SecF [Gemmatimonadetes bacterium]|nr:protein translocase subunit SecF [Gemmatimonadota bacterium]
MRLFANAHFDFLRSRKKAYVLSGTMLSLGLIGIVLNFATLGSWANYGVDFTGGTLIQVRMAEGVTDADLREALGGVNSPPITRFGAENEFVIRTPLAEGVDVAAADQGVRTELAASPTIGAFEVVRTEFVGPKIGAEMNQRAAMAILISFLLILVYLAFRFELRFGWAALIATAHDLFITLGFIALFRLEVSLTTVAAVLTIIGYSMNDTIIIFDRIRENLNKKGGRREDPLVLINRAINETLPRTILTVATVLATLLALLALGGPVVRDFTIVLILGVVIGTYSSIFVASPALVEIQRRWGTKEEAERKREAGRRPRGKQVIPV